MLDIGETNDIKGDKVAATINIDDIATPRIKENDTSFAT
jgi:hypothetical protein